ncbi:hypothetical protein B0I37DRAFT_124082 [Chaetomium sp. MPI-CAGE-AT-0009]|nr:hypothetical protein B0I37DRAFT_124082 [Chaetomium sp. MPI-CAGE-AT-0009]
MNQTGGVSALCFVPCVTDPLRCFLPAARTRRRRDAGVVAAAGQPIKTPRCCTLHQPPRSLSTYLQPTRCRKAALQVPNSNKTHTRYPKIGALKPVGQGEPNVRSNRNHLRKARAAGFHESSSNHVAEGRAMEVASLDGLRLRAMVKHLARPPLLPVTTRPSITPVGLVSMDGHPPSKRTRGTVTCRRWYRQRAATSSGWSV